MLSVLSFWTENGTCTISKSSMPHYIIRSILTSVVALILIFSCFNQQLWAYANKSKGQPDQTTNRVDGPHGKINFLSLLLYQSMLEKKQLKTNVTFDPVFRYQFRDNPVGQSARILEGESIYRSGYFYPNDAFKEGARIGPTYFCLTGNKKLKFTDWLIEAGFTADEPEVWMGLRHFYDPTTGKGLTDFSHDLITESGNVAVNEVLGRPDMDARTWALTGPADQKFAANPWSWEKGIEAMRKALAQTRSPELRDAQFVIAWRALGETMHLLADMTVPAHVRNDSHPGVYDYAGMAPDIYETFVTEQLIQSVWNKIIGNKSIDPALRDAVSWNMLQDMDKTIQPPDLFHCLATYTNSHFFSADTVSGTVEHGGQKVQILNANGQNAYPDPKLALCNPVVSKDRLLWPDTIYYQDFPMGSLTQTNKIKKIPVAQLSWTVSQGWFEFGKKSVQYNGFTASSLVNQAMAEHLLPIAIYANSKLIDWYLPRLEIVLDSLNLDKATLTGMIRHHPYGVHPQSTPLMFNLPEGGQWVRFHELYVDGKKLFADQYKLKIQNNQISVDLSPLKKPALTASSRVSMSLDMGGIRIQSGSIAPTEDCGYWVFTQIKETDEKFKWHGNGAKSTHEPGKNKISGSVNIQIPKLINYSVQSEIQWGDMPEVIPTGGRWAMEYQGKTESSGKPSTEVNDPNRYQISSGMTSAFPGPRHGEFQIDYRHEEAVSTQGPTLDGGIVSSSGLLNSGKGQIRAGQAGAKKAIIQFYLAAPSWRDSMTGGQRKPTEFFILTAQTPAGKVRQMYAYRFVKKLDPDQQKLLAQTLESPSYQGAVKQPKINFNSGATASAMHDSASSPTQKGGPKLTALRYVPARPKKQEPVVFKIEVVNPPESASYTWWMSGDVPADPKSAPQPTAWTDKPELRFTYGSAGTCQVTVWMKDKKTQQFVARQSWKIHITE
ncbi:MAG: hypothetical protein KKD32_02510 [Proteobacteria bacterium]|nr:hypothetical protein [Pseudomonadota bacterium]MBU1386703.1 hypothetical protein [Pseudomonadota bacterium]MBU2483145.1 hypothetical protein [Pseudomonadota bacterium]